MIRQLLYTSFSDDLTESKILELLDQSRQKNHSNDITGILLYNDGIFCQLLEGDSDAIGELFEKISNDSQHSHVSIVLDHEVDERLFSNWEMGFKLFDAGTQPDIEGWSDFLENPEGTLNTLKANSNVILSYLETFKQTL